MGHGKAIRELQLHGDANREKDILAACLKNTLFDYFCDESKGQFLADVLLATGRREQYLRTLIDLSGQIRTARDRSQWADLLAKLSKAGVTLAWTHIKDNWERELRRDQDDLAIAYVEGGGVRAYRAVLVLSEVLWSRRRKPAKGAFSIHMSADRTIGSEKAKTIRDSIAARSPRFAEIGDFPETYDAKRAQYTEPEDLPLAERVKAGRYIYFKCLKPSEIDQVAELLEKGLEGKPAARALRGFDERKFPLDLHILFRYLESDDDWVRCSALAALGSNPDPRIRELSRRFCDDGYLRGNAIGVLRSNFQPGDEVWIEQQLRRPNTAWWHHSTIGSVLDVIRDNPKGEWASILNLLLDTTACQICRRSVVEAMIPRRLLTAEDLAALALDACSRIRKSARRQIAARSRATNDA